MQVPSTHADPNWSPPWHHTSYFQTIRHSLNKIKRNRVEMLIFTKPHCRLLVASMGSFLWGFPSIWGEKVWSAKRLARRKFWLKNEPKTDKLDKRLEASRERGPLWVKAVLADPSRWSRASPLLGSQQILTISKSAVAFPTCLVKFKNKRKFPLLCFNGLKMRPPLAWVVKNATFYSTLPTIPAVWLSC